MSNTQLTGWALAARIASKWDSGFEQSPEDGSYASVAALPVGEAKAMVDALRAAGIEASEATDSEDRAKAWVYITVG